MIAKCMLKNIRRNAGLGEPPVPYYNNIPESANALIKRAVGFKESEMTAFCKSMSTLVLKQKEDVDSAIFNTGPYQLSVDFQSFEVPQTSWFKMSTKQREDHLRKFREARMTAASNDDETSNVTEQQSTPTANKFSVNFVSANVVSAPEEILNSIARKAEELLNSPQSIVCAPGSADNSTYIVESKMSAKPHFVSLAKNGKATCEDCPGWKSLKLCSHAVAAAEKRGRLLEYVNWLKKKGPSRMNITSYVTCDSGNGIGKKGGKPTTARRKGGRTANRLPAKNVVDRPLPPTIEAFLPAIMLETLPQVTPSPTTTYAICIVYNSASFATIHAHPATIHAHPATIDAFPSTTNFSLATISTHAFSNALGGQRFKPNAPKSYDRNIYVQSIAILSFDGTFVLWLLPDIETRWHYSSSSIRHGCHVENAETFPLANR